MVIIMGHTFCWKSKSPERCETDGFITWGWDDGSKNILKGFNFKNYKKNIKSK